MRLSALISVLVGVAIVVGLVYMNGAAGITAGIEAARWGLVAVVAIHLPQVFCSGLGWRALVPVPRVPPWTSFFGLRLIREGVNGLLPVAQLGGHVVGARLLARNAVPLSLAGASVAVDLTLEMLSQVAFTLAGVTLLLLLDTGGGQAGVTAGSVLAGLAVLSGTLVVAQRYGLFRLLEKALVRLAERQNWDGLKDVSGLHDAIVMLYRSPRRLLVSFVSHFCSWLLGGVEVLVVLRVLGIEVSLVDAMVIEALGQAFRAVGFAMPGGLGIQESGVVLICGILGIGPQAAIELSLLRRVRELVLGVPALAAWYWLERPRARPLALAAEEPMRETVS